MSVIKKEVDIAKELDDVCGLIVSLLSDIKAKKPLSDILSQSVAKLIDAVSGIDQVSSELKDSREAAINAVALNLSKIASVLVPAEKAV